MVDINHRLPIDYPYITHILHINITHSWILSIPSFQAPPPAPPGSCAAGAAAGSRVSCDAARGRLVGDGGLSNRNHGEPGV